MKRKFVMTKSFDRSWTNMGLTDKDLQRLQSEILQNPSVGAVMEGTGGLRKMRFAFEGQGKSGSARVTYVDFILHDTVYLIYAYPKSEKDNLTKKERNDMKKVIEAIEKVLG